MNEKDRLLSEYEMEMASTRKLLERVPEGKWDWQPHAKSMTLGRIANHLANLPGWTRLTALESSFDLMPPGQEKVEEPSVETLREVLETFDRNVTDGKKAMADMTIESLNDPWEFKFGGKTMWTHPRGQVLRGMIFNHNVHHRAQLGVFLRLNGVALPSIYGPSADEQPFG